jgi:putative transposase
MTVAGLAEDFDMHPPRLGRLDRYFPGYSIFFVTCCTHQRANILANPVIHEAFRNFCRSAKERQVFVGRYVLMPDHMHFFVDCGVLLSDWMKSLKNALSKCFRQQGNAAPHWQKGFFDYLVRSERSYEEKWQYTFDNPVRAKLVVTPEEWPYQGEMEYLPFA